MLNPNSARISDPLWWFVEQCTALMPTSFSDEYGGTYTDKAGSHNTRNNLIAQGRTNDYSIRDPLNKLGPGDKTAAFDWTFPSAQSGNYSSIVLFSARVKVAYETRDPRTYGLQEVLCEADFDYDPEGYVFYPSRSTRTPDRTHKWHIHFGFIRKFLNDWAAFDAVFSIIKGESLDSWKARTGQGGGSGTSTAGSDIVAFMAQISGSQAVSVSTTMEVRPVPDYPTFVIYRDTLKLPFVVFPNKQAFDFGCGRDWMADEQPHEQKVVFEIDDAAAAKIAAAIDAQPGNSLTADELRAIMDEDNKAQAVATADELKNRLGN